MYCKLKILFHLFLDSFRNYQQYFGYLEQLYWKESVNCFITAIQKEQLSPLTYYFLLTHHPGCSTMREECVHTTSYCNPHMFSKALTNQKLSLSCKHDLWSFLIYSNVSKPVKNSALLMKLLNLVITDFIQSQCAIYVMQYLQM